jgi:hypothetical protein
MRLCAADVANLWPRSPIRDLFRLAAAEVPDGFQLQLAPGPIESTPEAERFSITYEVRTVMTPAFRARLEALAHFHSLPDPIQPGDATLLTETALREAAEMVDRHFWPEHAATCRPVPGGEPGPIRPLSLPNAALLDCAEMIDRHLSLCGYWGCVRSGGMTDFGRPRDHIHTAFDPAPRGAPLSRDTEEDPLDDHRGLTALTDEILPDAEKPLSGLSYEEFLVESQKLIDGQGREHR